MYDVKNIYNIFAKGSIFNFKPINISKKECLTSLVYPKELIQSTCFLFIALINLKRNFLFDAFRVLFIYILASFSWKTLESMLMVDKFAPAIVICLLLLRKLLWNCIQGLLNLDDSTSR